MSARRGRLALALLALCFAPAAFAATISRGPYLQLAGPNGVTVVFRSDTVAVGRVRYGTDPTNLDRSVTGGQATTAHALRLSELAPSTRYHYAVDLDGVPAAAGPGFTFRTYPPRGTHQPFRFFAWGDSGTADARQYAVANRLDDELAEAAFSLILGDIIYPAGEWQGYGPRFFQPYRDLLRRQVIWPTIGNHDVGTEGGAPYLDAFVLPANNPEGTELYYSFDFGDAHFVCLDTHATWADPAAKARQLAWAEADLAASTARWKFVFFHKPPYSGGTHDDAADVKADLVPLLERQDVDVVFAGHSHVYERTFLLQGNAILQGDPAAYTKFSGADGTLYVVSGTAGQSGALSNAAHPLMAFQKGDVLGGSIIDVSGPVVRGYFLDDAGGAHDLFTLYKELDSSPPRLTAVRAGPATTQLTVTFDEPVRLDGASFAIEPPVAVSGTALGSDGRTLTVTTASHPPGAYALAISGLSDRATTPNVLAPVQVLYRFDAPGAGPPPHARDVSPAPGAAGVPLGAALSVRVVHDGVGVDAGAIELWVQGLRVAPQVRGTANDWVVSHAPPDRFGPGERVEVEVRATDRNGVVMAPFAWSFTTERVSPLATACGCSAASLPPWAALGVFALVLRRRRGNLGGGRP